LISIVEKSSNHVAGDDTALQVPGEIVVCYEVCPVFNPVFVIGKYKNIFGGVGIFLWGKLSAGDFFRREDP